MADPQSTTRSAVLESTAIHAILAHRYPFLFVDRIVILEPGRWVVGTKRISAGEWWCDGMEDVAPVFPHSLVIEALAQTSGALIRDLVGGADGTIAYFMGLDRVRLRRAVHIGDELRMDLTLRRWRRGICNTYGVASVDGHVVASAQLTTITRGSAR
jgi:3-hydroxyacyl-[acyl-carrier-protein] dehydratase